MSFGKRCYNQQLHSFRFPPGMSDPKAADACRSKARECLDRAERLSASIQRERREGRYREEVKEAYCLIID